jgi:hypothetical protein
MDEPAGGGFVAGDLAPHWFLVAFVVGFVASASAFALACFAKYASDGFEPPRDLFGWGNMQVMFAGFLATPLYALGGAIGGGVTAFKSARANIYTVREIWKRSFGRGFLVALLLGSPKRDA